jgi:hypothetical protein
MSEHPPFSLHHLTLFEPLIASLIYPTLLANWRSIADLKLASSKIH